MEEKQAEEVNDFELINNLSFKIFLRTNNFFLIIDDSDNEFIEGERKKIKMTKEEKEKIVKAQQKDQYKEEKMLKKGLI